MRRYQLIPSYATQTLQIASTSPLPGGLVGTPYSYTFSAIGGVQPYSWAIISGSIPPGLSLVGPTLAGTPTGFAVYSFVVQVTDSVGTPSAKNFNLTIVSTLTLTGGALPAATQYSPYSVALTPYASGGTPPYSFSILSNGHNSYSVSGQNLTCTPTMVLTDPLTIQVTDSLMVTAQAAFTVAVTAAATAAYKFVPGDAMADYNIYATTYAQAQADILILKASPVPGPNQIYICGFNWGQLETGTDANYNPANITAQYGGFTLIAQIFNYLQSEIPGAYFGFYVTAQKSGGNCTNAYITSHNFGQSNNYAPADIVNCGGTLNPHTYYGSSTFMGATPVAPIYSGSAYYGLGFSAASGGAFQEVIPAWWNPAVNQRWIQMFQALAQYTFTITAGPLNGQTLGLDANPYFCYLASNDETSYSCTSSDNNSGLTVNPPLTTGGAAPGSTANFYTARKAFYTALTAAFPTTIIGACESYGFSGSTAGSSSQMAAFINANASPVGGAPTGISSVIGVAMSGADTYGLDWNATTSYANAAKQGFIGVSTNATGGTGGALPAAQVASLRGVMPYVAQIQPGDYSKHFASGIANYSDAAVLSLMQSAVTAQAYMRIWCIGDNNSTNQWTTGNSGSSYTHGIQGALVTNYAANPVNSTLPTSLGGATQVFSYNNNFSDTALHRRNSASYNGSNQLVFFQNVGHQSAQTWYSVAQQPPTAFTTTFSFTVAQLSTVQQATGIAFVIQNTVSPPGQAGVVGLGFADDANMCGFGGAVGQYPPVDSIAIKFDAGTAYVTSASPAGTLPSSTGLYINGGPSVQNGQTLGLTPYEDITPYGINFYNVGHVFQVTMVYDGTLLTMVIKDTTTSAQARFVWPLNLAATTNPVGNWVGLTGGNASTSGPWGQYTFSSWAYYTGYNTRLATPTFSPTPGQYSGTQTVTLSYPAGSTCYYTTNGLLPTAASTLYTGPITVSANEVLQAVAIQTGYTDSLVASGVYKINTASTINFASFAAGNLIPVGYTYLSGSAYRLTDSTTGNTAGSLWFPVPVTVSTFSTAFTIAWTGSGQGLCFVIQNKTPVYATLSGVQITGSGGQISFASNTQIQAGFYINITGTLPVYPAAGSIQGYTSGTAYYVSAATTTTATLQTASQTALTTTVGTPSGPTWTVNTPSYPGGPFVVAISDRALGYAGLDCVNNSANFASLGILNSVAIAFDQSKTPSSVGLYTGGDQPLGSQHVTTGSFNFSGGGTYNVTLSYDGTTLTLTMQSSGGGATFTQTWPINIPTTVGGSTAYVGFTGASGGAATIAAITKWSGF